MIKAINNSMSLIILAILLLWLVKTIVINDIIGDLVGTSTLQPTEILIDKKIDHSLQESKTHIYVIEIQKKAEAIVEFFGSNTTPIEALTVIALVKQTYLEIHPELRDIEHVISFDEENNDKEKDK